MIMSSLLRGSSEQEAFGQLHRITPSTSGDLMTWSGQERVHNDEDAALLVELPNGDPGTVQAARAILQAC